MDTSNRWDKDWPIVYSTTKATNSAHEVRIVVSYLDKTWGYWERCEILLVARQGKGFSIDGFKSSRCTNGSEPLKRRGDSKVIRYRRSTLDYCRDVFRAFTKN